MGSATRVVGRLFLVFAAGASLAACASVHPEYSTQFAAPTHQATRTTPGGGGYKVGAPYQVGGVWYVPREQPDYDQEGIASWYGEQFNLKATANGEIFDKTVPSAAHPTLPLPSLVEVTNLDNGRKLIVRVNDRGPYVGGRLIDLSEEAARELGYEKAGLARVRVRYVGRAPLYGQDSIRYAKVEPLRMQLAAAASPKHSAVQPTRPVRHAKTGAAEVMLTSAPLAKPSTMIVQSTLAPLTGHALPDLTPKRSLKLAAAPPASGYRIQVGAFANSDNADRAVAQLASTGQASIVPMARDGSTLYRVVLDAANEDEAEALRQKVAEAGFADATVIRPF